MSNKETLAPPFKKGESGNPNGRPKGQRNYATIYKEALIKLGTINGKTPEELETELIASGFAMAKKDFRFYKDVLDRIHGTAVHNQDLTSGGDKIDLGVVILPTRNGTKDTLETTTETGDSPS